MDFCKHTHTINMARVGGYLVSRTFAFLNRTRPRQLTCTRLGFVPRQYVHSTTACCVPGVVKGNEDPLELTNKDWESRLTSDQYYVCREKGTEMPFSGDLLHNQEQGTYDCVCCGVPLFSSQAKYDSGSGWPSFTAALGAEGKDESKCNVLRCGDNSHGMTRIEVVCKKCDAHLGHVFPDGPPPTGDRFCMNSVSLSFVPTDAES